MRKLLLLPLVLWACGGAKDAPPADTAAMAPAALTAADVVGSYVGTTMANGTDSVLSTWTSIATADSTGALSGKLMDAKAPTDSVAFTGMLSADSVVWSSAPFTQPGSPAGSPQMKWIAVGRAAGTAWTGTAVTMIAATDSVVQNSHWTAARTP
jgi:hypothetical protein